MADTASLLVFALVTSNFSVTLVCLTGFLSGKISAALGFFIHFFANLSESSVRLSLKVLRLHDLRAS